MKAYLKIGIYQSVVPCTPDDPAAVTLSFPIAGAKYFDPLAELRFHFKESDARERDGTPIWVADCVRIEKRF